MAKTQFIWDPMSDNVLQEKDELGATQATYTYEPGPFGNLISQSRGGTTSYYHFDAQGSTRELTDSSGNVTDTNMYDAWGVNVGSTGSTENPYGWIGKWGYRDDSGLSIHDVRNRQYQQLTARWLTLDPQGFIDGPNLYVYVQNQPVTSVDPSGLQTQLSDSAFSDRNLELAMKSRKPDERGCVELVFTDYLKLININPRRPPIEVYRGAYRGCVGITSVHQLCEIPKQPAAGWGKYPSPFELFPENEEHTFCFLERGQAIDHECPKKRPSKLFFVIEGVWKDGKRPPAGSTEPVPPDTVQTINSDVGDYNYITMVGKFCVAMNHGRLKPGGKAGLQLDPRLREDPVNKQTIKICRSTNGIECAFTRSNGELAYPARVHCVTCKCQSPAS